MRGEFSITITQVEDGYEALLPEDVNVSVTGFGRTPYGAVVEAFRLAGELTELGEWTLKAVETENGYKTVVLGDPLAEGDEVRVREIEEANDGA